MGVADGADDMISMTQAGFTASEVNDWRAQKTKDLTAAGFSSDEVGKYFGDKTPDMKPVAQYIQQNLANYKQSQNIQGTKGSPVTVPGDAPLSGNPSPQDGAEKPKEASNWIEAIEAGLQMSTAGLAIHGKPTTVLPEHADMAMRMLGNSATLAGDIPAMVGGAVAGGVAGAGVGTIEAPIVGTIAGGAAGSAFGAWALPAALRRVLMDHYDKGDIKDFKDFYERAAGTLLDAVKAGTTGLLTAGAGAAAGLASAGASAAVQTTSKLAAELGTMTTVGAAMDGHVPKAADFVDGGLMLIGLHGAMSGADYMRNELPAKANLVSSKLREIYAQTGLKPEQVVLQAQTDPVVRQNILSLNPNIPESYAAMAEKPGPGSEVLSPKKPDMVNAKVPPEMAEQHPTLGEGFALDSDFKVPKIPEEGKPAVSEVLTPAEQIRERVGEDASKNKMSASDVYTKVFDRLNPINKFVEQLSRGERPSVDQDPYAAFRMLGGADGKSDVAIKYGPRDVEGNKTGTPGIMEIMKSSGDVEGLENYAIAKHAIELEEAGKETGVPLDAAHALVESDKAKFEKPLQEWVKFQNDRLGYLRDSGVISDKIFDESVSKWKSYIPFNRVDADGKSSGGVSSTMPIKAIYGSDMKLRSPIESTIRNTFAYTRSADENAAKLKFVDFALQSEEGRALVRKVKQPLSPVNATEEEVRSFMAKNGMEGDATSMQIFRPLSQTLAPDEIAVMRDGKREVYQVGEDIKKAIDAEPYNAPAILKMASIPTKMLRIGAVDTVDFLARHAMRDATNAFLYSNNGYKWGFSTLYGLKEYFTNSDVYHDYLSSGAGMSNFTELDRDYLKKDIFNLSKETGLIDNTTNLIKNPLELWKTGLDIMHYLAQGVVSAPRIAEFELAREAGKSNFEAGYDSRNVTIDNQRMGAANSVRMISQLHAFWNTRMQGNDMLARAFAADPVKMASRLALAVTLPSLGLWWINKDDPRYVNAPQIEKDLCFFIPTPWAMMRFPKPFEAGLLFGSLPERVMDALYRMNPEAFKNFGSTLFEAGIPNPLMIDAAKPAIEQFANRSLLSGGTIVPHSLEEVAPAYQYTPYTTETAKQIGKLLSYVPVVKDLGHGNITLASPPVIENYVRAWGGGLGTYALQLADQALTKAGIASPPPKPAATLSDIPVIKSFVVRYPSANAQPIQDFYDNYDKAQTAIATRQSLVKSGNEQEAAKYINAQQSFVNLGALQSTIGKQSRMITLLNENPTMKPSDKRKLIDSLYLQMIQTATAGNKLYRAFSEGDASK